MSQYLSEEAVVGGSLVWAAESRGPFPREVLALEPEHFDEEGHRRIWSAVTHLLHEGAPCDLRSVGAKLLEIGNKELLSRAAELESIGLPSSLAHHAKLVWAAGQKRRLSQTLADIFVRANGDFESVSDEVFDAVRRFDRQVTDGGLRHIREPLREMVARLEELSKNPNAFRLCSTGLSDLDDILSLEAGAQTIVAARPGMGKTALAGCIAREVSRDITQGSVAMFSLEMAAVALVTRLTQGESRTELRRLTDTKRLPAVHAAIDRLWSCGLYFDDRGGLSTDDMYRALKRMDKVRLVIVDYLQLAKAPPRERQDLRIGAVTKGLKEIAKYFNCHVIALSQLNRGVEQRDNKRPRMSDLRDSGAIEEDADNILFLYRDDYYDPTSSDIGTAEIHISKQRNGSTGMVRVKWCPQYQLFTDYRR